jgi:hypothetical protein
MTTRIFFTHSPRNKKFYPCLPKASAVSLPIPLAAPRTCYPLVDLPRFGDALARTSDDDHLALSTLSIDEELIIRNRGRHVEVRAVVRYLPLALISQEVADARPQSTALSCRHRRSGHDATLSV